MSKIINNEIKTFHYDNGDLQKVQIITLHDFQDFDFFTPNYDERSFEEVVNLYRDFIIKKYAAIFGKIVIYRLPEEETTAFSMETKDLGKVLDPLAVVTKQFKENIICHKGKLSFKNKEVESYFEKLKNTNNLYVAQGKRNTVRFLPVGKHMGFLSQNEQEALLKVNASFFVMDQLDCGSVFDHVGIPIGLAVKNGVIYNPPQFDREVFMVRKNQKPEITSISLQQLTIEIDGVSYRHNENCHFYSRPNYRYSPKSSFDIVILNNEVVALNANGGSEVPSGGFVIQINQPILEIQNTKVFYHGLEDVVFAIQVGNSAVVNGKETNHFISPFYRFYNVFATSFPPSMYPLNYKKARAPRIVLGNNEKDQPVLLWFEGAGKFGYQKGIDSCGASLKECATIAKGLGLVNAIHLDGGGSAQILVNNQRALQISDRNPEDYSQRERAIPMGLIVK